jgi:hypothetical protein
MLAGLRSVLPLTAALLLSGCETTRTHAPTSSEAGRSSAGAEQPGAADKTKDDAEDAEDKRVQRGKLQRELAIARIKKEQAELARDLQEADDRDALADVTIELDIATKKLRQLQGKDGPARIERARFELQIARDSFQEAGEELAQLKMMYAETDLADKTKEIVIQRAERRLERAKWDLTMKEKALDTLETTALPLELDEARKSVDQATRKLEDQKRTTRANSLEKRIGVLNAEEEIAKLEEEIAAIDRKLAKQTAQGGAKKEPEK